MSYDEDSDAQILASAILSVGRVQAICPPNLDCANFAEAIVIHAAVMKDEVAPGIHAIAEALNRIAEALETK